MKTETRLMACCLMLLLPAAIKGQIHENTFSWHSQDHSGWKGISNFPNGYVIAGNKFFEPANTNMHITGFNDFCQHQWTVTHPTAQHSFSTLSTFWKSFTSIGSPLNPEGFFIAATGTRSGTNHYYTLLTDKSGQLVQERFGPLPNGFTFGGAGQATDGGFIAVGGDNSGNVAAVKFNASGEAVTSVTLAIYGFGWTVQSAPGGGYVIGSTSARVTRIDESLNLVWTKTIPLPVSPDGSNYTYTEFEEICPLLNTGSGFVMTGSAFSNSTSAAYTGRVNWDGTIPWSKINDSVNTALAGTPVSWSNSAIELQNPQSGVWEIFYTWRKGPVSNGGTLFGERMNPTNGDQIQFGSLGNTIPVQEAFTIRQYFTNRVIIAGTRGSYSAAYAFSADNLPTALAAPSAAPPPAGEVTQSQAHVGVTNARPQIEQSGAN